MQSYVNRNTLATNWFNPAHVVQIKKKRKRKGLELDAPEVVMIY